MAKQINKEVAEWSDDEFVQWAKGTLQIVEPITTAMVVEEAKKRIGEGGKVIKSAHDARRALLAIAREEDEKNRKQDGVELVKPEKTEEEKEEQARKVKEASKAVPSVRPEVGSSTTEQMVKENLDKYVEFMQPGRAHRGNDGVQRQVMLFRTIQVILRQKGPEFHKLWSYLLWVVNKHRDDVFHERYVFRYFDMINLSNSERRCFERILNLIINTANPSTRAKAVQQIDIDATMEVFNDPEMHQRVQGFYTGM